VENSEQRLKTKEYWQTKIREAENFLAPRRVLSTRGTEQHHVQELEVSTIQEQQEKSCWTSNAGELCFCSSENSETKSGSFAP
jgi:hypothetical protein